jgi:hypothetical protein
MLASAPHCANCDTALYGRFCSLCGQDSRLTAITLSGLIRDYFAAYVAYDGLVWRTLVMLAWRPGQLTLDFFAGRRARYLHPRRLYLFTSIIYFVCFSGRDPAHHGVFQFDCAALASRHFGADDIAVDVDITVGEHDPSWLRQLVAAVKDKKKNLLSLSPQGACQRFVDLLGSQIPTVAFILLPFFAVILKIFYWRRTYVEHLLFGVYEHAFAFLIFFLSALADLAGLTTVSTLLGVSIAVHLFLALRRVYGKTWLGTSWRFVAIASCYLVTVGGALAAAALYAAWHTV